MIIEWLSLLIVIAGFSLFAAFILCAIFFVFAWGYYRAVKDAEERLRGLKPVDEFWRKHGMK